MCQSCVHYADMMSKKVDRFQPTSRSNEFEVTPQWCFAMNNIDYVRQCIEPLVQELGVAQIAEKLAETSSTDVLRERFERTLKEMVDNANATVSEKQRDLISNAINKMLPVIQKLLLELEKDMDYLDKLMTYLDNSLVTMKEQMSEDNFDRVLDSISKSVFAKIEDITKSGLKQKKPLQFFKHLLEIFDVLVDYFNKSNEAIDKVRQSLELYSLSTDELIHKYYLEHCQTIQSNGDNGGDCGQLTIRAMILKNQGLLKIEIMNCRSLKPVRSNGTCNPSVKINFLPEEQFLTTSKPRTQNQKNNLFPLFDETLEIVLTNDQLSMKETLIQFEVVDHYFLCINNFVAECFYLLNEIKLVDDSEELMNMSQIHLKLGKPSWSSKNDSKIWDVIEQRSLSFNDRKAKAFIRRQKARMDKTNCQEGRSSEH
ncbi:hypothetical protein WDU94_013736 [Cyamophila willieti]